MFPKMNYAKRFERAEEKKSWLLNFLADFEVYTTIEIASQIMCVSRRRGIETINKLQSEHFLKSEMHYVEGRSMRIIGITEHGLASVDAEGDAPYFQLGKTNSSYITHKIHAQLLRLKATGLGCEWMSERKILQLARKKGGWKKIPDAWCSIPAGITIAVEVERYVKSQKRYEEIVTAYSETLSINEIHYVTPAGLSSKIQDSFSKCRNLPTNWQDRFKFFEFDNWNPLCADPHGEISLKPSNREFQ